jgi:hypothetical protein
MAVKTKKKKPVHHRRKVGAIDKGALEMGIGAAVGAAVGWYVYTTQKTIQDSLMGLLQIGAGLAALLFVKMPIAQGVGLGLIGSGAIIEGESFGFLSGVTNLPQTKQTIAGYGAVHQLGMAPTFPRPSAVGKAKAPMYQGGIYSR